MLCFLEPLGRGEVPAGTVLFEELVVGPAVGIGESLLEGDGSFQVAVELGKAVPDVVPAFRRVLLLLLHGLQEQQDPVEAHDRLVVVLLDPGAFRCGEEDLGRKDRLSLAHAALVVHPGHVVLDQVLQEDLGFLADLVVLVSLGDLRGDVAGELPVAEILVGLGLLEKGHVADHADLEIELLELGDQLVDRGHRILVVALAVVDLRHLQVGRFGQIGDQPGILGSEALGELQVDPRLDVVDLLRKVESLVVLLHLGVGHSLVQVGPEDVEIVFRGVPDVLVQRLDRLVQVVVPVEVALVVDLGPVVVGDTPLVVRVHGELRRLVGQFDLSVFPESLGFPGEIVARLVEHLDAFAEVAFRLAFELVLAIGILGDGQLEAEEAPHVLEENGQIHPRLVEVGVVRVVLHELLELLDRQLERLVLLLAVRAVLRLPPQDLGVGEQQGRLLLLVEMPFLDRVHVVVGQVEVSKPCQVDREIEVVLDVGFCFIRILGQDQGGKGKERCGEKNYGFS